MFVSTHMMENFTPDQFAFLFCVLCTKLLKILDIILDMKHKQILCIDLGLIPKIPHYYKQVFQNMESPKIQDTSGHKHFG